MRPFRSSFQELDRPRQQTSSVFILNDFIRHDHECLGVTTVLASLSRPPPKKEKTLLMQHPGSVPRDVYSEQTRAGKRGGDPALG